MMISFFSCCKDTKVFPFHLFHNQISYYFLLKKNKSPDYLFVRALYFVLDSTKNRYKYGELFAAIPL